MYMEYNTVPLKTESELLWWRFGLLTCFFFVCLFLAVCDLLDSLIQSVQGRHFSSSTTLFRLSNCHVIVVSI